LIAQRGQCFCWPFDEAPAQFFVRDDLANQHLHCSLRHTSAFPRGQERQGAFHEDFGAIRLNSCDRLDRRCIWTRKLRISAQSRRAVQVRLARNIGISKCLTTAA
jgi:hypothetical protein